MTKLYLAMAVLIPLVGCTAAIDEDSTLFGPDASNATGAANTGGTSQIGNGSVNAGAAGRSGSAGNTDPGSGLGIGGASAFGGSSSGGACTLEALPAIIQTMLTSRCATCHGTTPLAATLPTLLTYRDLTAPAKSDPSKTNAVVALARLQSTTMPMPPAPGSPASASEISALQDFVAQGYPKPTCPVGTGGSGSGGGSSANGPSEDPLFAMPICTSKKSWTGGNRESASMNPGMACISCHKSEGEGPAFTVAGTLYPTGHEPDKCNSNVGNSGARIVIVGADGKTLTLTPNDVGNFSSNAAIKPPYQAKVTYQGRERLMLTPQTSGDCNSCHSQSGSLMAPGRVTVP